MTADEFLAWLTPPAQEVCATYDLPYQVCVAQGAIESEWGKYGLGNGGFNLFGRKWGGTGAYVELPTQECYSGVWQTIIAKFQSYSSLQEAVKDWCELMNWKHPTDPAINYKKYADQYHNDHDVESFVRGIAPIYATNPSYTEDILATIRACGMA